MCGRYALSASADLIVAELDVDTVEASAPEAPFNIAPTQQSLVVLERVVDDEVTRELRSMRWGLVPSWAKDTTNAARLINARSETVTQKPSFRAAAASRRILVPASGYYEWAMVDGVKTPYFLHAHDVELLAFAGLFEWWKRPDVAPDAPDRWLATFTVITRPATDALGHIHDRTPVIVPPALRSDWLNPMLTDLLEVESLLEAIPDPDLAPRKVSTLVNSVRNNGPELLDEVD